MKNAIWSAIPNFSMVISNNPLVLAVSLATQIGTGYMNYRREKCAAGSEREDAQVELEITAIEQLNALRRELFTTAWRLADTYDFEDKWRLTEKQIKQYNAILMDFDDLRKYVRLEAIKDKFEAFPPFWYFFGHTACAIAENKELDLEPWERAEYTRRAKEHFAYYETLNKYNILREDQITASFALEYADLLLNENEPDREKISDLLKTALEMSGEDNDIKEICAISYLRLGQTAEAAKWLLQLVNEDYNMITNAKLLSRIYVSQFLRGESKTARFDYKTLVMRVGKGNEVYLYPMPENRISDDQLQEEYISEQKSLLQNDYRKVIIEIQRKYTRLFNAVFPAPYNEEPDEEYFSYTEEASRRRYNDMVRVLENETEREQFCKQLKEIGFRFRFLDLLNESIESCDELDLWSRSEYHDKYIWFVRKNLLAKSDKMKEIQERIEKNTFSINDYETIQDELSFCSFMRELLAGMRTFTVNAIEEMTTFDEIQQAEYNLVEFCEKQGIVLDVPLAEGKTTLPDRFKYLDEGIFGEDGALEKYRKEERDRIRRLVREAAPHLLKEGAADAAVIVPEEDPDQFRQYFENSNLKSGPLKEKVMLIIDDTTRKDRDLLLLENSLCMIVCNDKGRREWGYNDVTYHKQGAKEWLELVYKTRKYMIYEEYEEYSNKKVNIARLYGLIEQIRN